MFKETVPNLIKSLDPRLNPNYELFTDRAQLISKILSPTNAYTAAG
ncbi:UNVERIFIED_CONTAM: hypothetical protein O8I53_09640 [Campylobacter lari]